MKPITYLTGDAIAPIGEGFKIIAHCCNDIGAWGSGFVMALSRRWLAPEYEYRDLAAHTQGRMRLGTVQLVTVEESVSVANIIGQRGCGFDNGKPPINYQALCDGFNTVCEHAKRLEASVHMPRIGCGLAGGQWGKVEQLIEVCLCAQDIPVFVYDLPTGRAA